MKLPVKLPVHYTDELALLPNALDQVESLWHSLEQAARLASI